MKINYYFDQQLEISAHLEVVSGKLCQGLKDARVGRLATCTHEHALDPAADTCHWASTIAFKRWPNIILNSEELILYFLKWLTIFRVGSIF